MALLDRSFLNTDVAEIIFKVNKSEHYPVLPLRYITLMYVSNCYFLKVFSEVVIAHIFAYFILLLL